MLPNDSQSRAQVDDRRVLDGIVHVLISCGRCTDAPREIYGPKKTRYNRFMRWAAKGTWVELFEALAQAVGAPAQVLSNSCLMKAHRLLPEANVWPTPSASGSESADLSSLHKRILASSKRLAKMESARLGLIKGSASNAIFAGRLPE